MERKQQRHGPGFTNNLQNTEVESLSDKLKNHYRTNKSKKFHERVDAWTQFMVRLPLPVPVLLTTVLVTWYFGVTEVVPEIHGTYGSLVWYLHVSFGTFLTWQIFVFWCGIRFLDSSYKAFKSTTSQLKLSPTNHHDTYHDNLYAKDRVICDFKTRELQEKSNVEYKTRDQIFCNRMSYSANDGSSCGNRNKIQKGSDTVWDLYLLPGFCVTCNDVRPARCHHCPVCDVCVLKRDHHCYFAGSCVGWRNHRYFVVFCFWAAVGSLYVSVHLFLFIYKTLWASMSYADLLLPCALLRCFTGHTSLSVVIYISLTSCHLYCLVLGTKFLVEHIYLVMKGLTTFENNPKRKGLRVVDSRSTSDKLRSVFGRYYLLNWLIPTHWVFPSSENPIIWPDIKIR